MALALTSLVSLKLQFSFIKLLRLRKWSFLTNQLRHSPRVVIYWIRWDWNRITCRKERNFVQDWYLDGIYGGYANAVDVVSLRRLKGKNFFNWILLLWQINFINLILMHQPICTMQKSVLQLKCLIYLIQSNIQLKIQVQIG